MSSTTITLVFCLGGITFLVNWVVFLLLNHKKLERIHLELIQFSRSKWNEGCDIVIMGHYHHSFNFNEGQKQLIILDDCCDQKFNYAKYDGDSISVESL